MKNLRSINQNQNVYHMKRRRFELEKKRILARIGGAESEDSLHGSHVSEEETINNSIII